MQFWAAKIQHFPDFGRIIWLVWNFFVSLHREINYKMATKNSIGYVYIFTNKSFREGWVKIGKTQNIKQRLLQLDNTSCPLPFDVYATLKTNRYDEAEDFVHEFISHFNQSLRIRPNREYFNVSPEEALDILYKVKRLMNEPDAEIIVYDERGKKHVSRLEKKHTKCEGKIKECSLPVSCKTNSTGSVSQKMVWLLPSNIKYFDLRKCYKQEGRVFWQIKNNFKKVQDGDIGYIYSSHPDKAIIYSFEVIKANMPYISEVASENKYFTAGNNKDWGNKGGRFALLKLTELSNKKNLTLSLLKKNGLNGAPQNAIMLSQKKYENLLSYIVLITHLLSILQIRQI
ncbi:MAG: GIY-YIG nuclease family protein [Bacteroidales bacterium]|nr:GIY-YIG nuclease family protein [Bacteroidales bacterium]